MPVEDGPGRVDPMQLAHTAVHGYGAVQKAEELAELIGMVADLKPQVIVEIGSYAGGTLYAWSQLAPTVIAVDLEAASVFAATGAPRQEHGAVLVAGDSHDPATLEKLRAELAGRPVDLLFIDGDHSYDGVRQDHLMYAPLVRPGGLIAFHDIRPHPPSPDIEVDRFWREARDERAIEIIHGEAPWGGIGVLHASGQPARLVHERGRRGGVRREGHRAS